MLLNFLLQLRVGLALLPFPLEALNVEGPDEALEALPEVVRHFKVIALVREVLLHGGVRLIDDGQEHVEEDEKDEEDVEEEEDGPVYAVSVLQGVKLKVTQDDAQQGEGGVAHVTVLSQLTTQKKKRSRKFIHIHFMFSC